ncbi:MAG: DUF4184 family protein [bacterium]|nr:DUF4184 family protein [bacterium]
MPFTFAHPAVVLPLCNKGNKYVDKTALIIGAMAPDFEYFIHFRPYQVYGHTILGQFYFNLPLVLAISFIYHYLLKESFIRNLPKPYNRYYLYMLNRKWKIKSIRHLLVFIYSALLGMFTHLFWDAFTHKTGYFVTRVEAFNYNFHLFSFTVPVYKLLQHGSSVIGLIIIIFFIWSIRDKKYINNHMDISGKMKFLFWGSFVVLTLVGSSFLFILLNDFSIGRIVVGSMSFGFICLILISLLFKLIDVKCKKTSD